MKRCQSKIKSGRQCLNSSLEKSDFCGVHQSAISSDRIFATGAGALLGNAVLPGLGGVVLGGLVGSLVRTFLNENTIKKTRVFVSFDFDNDRILKEFILGQAKLPDSPFEIIDHSLKEAAPEKTWQIKANAAINSADIMLVIVGQNTFRAQGVLKEVEMARVAGVKIVQIIGYKTGNYTPVPNAGRLYTWNWNNLKNLLS